MNTTDTLVVPFDLFLDTPNPLIDTFANNLLLLAYVSRWWDPHLFLLTKTTMTSRLNVDAELKRER